MEISADGAKILQRGDGVKKELNLSTGDAVCRLDREIDHTHIFTALVAKINNGEHESRLSRGEGNVGSGYIQL